MVGVDPQSAEVVVIGGGPAGATTATLVAADAICAALDAGDTSADQLGTRGPEYVRGMQRMRRLVCEFYEGFNFGRCVKKHPHLKGHVTDLPIGDLFNDRVDEIVAPLEGLWAEDRVRA